MSRATLLLRRTFTSAQNGRSASRADMYPGDKEGKITYLHTMIRVLDLEKSVQFFNTLGLMETRRRSVPAGRFTLVFMAPKLGDPEIELTHNWDEKEPYTEGRNFGHLAFAVDDIYDVCHTLQNTGVKIVRPPHDGMMAFVRSPDNISIELLQKGQALEPSEPWTSMDNIPPW
eukprot:g8713.t1